MPGAWNKIRRRQRRLLSRRRPSPMLDEDACQDVASNAQERNTSMIVTKLWRLAVALPERNYLRRRERLFCGIWSLTFPLPPSPRKAGSRNTTINDILSEEMIFYSYEHLNNCRTSRTFILTDFSVYKRVYWQSSSRWGKPGGFTQKRGLLAHTEA